MCSAGSITKTSFNLTQSLFCLQHAIDTALKWKALRIDSWRIGCASECRASRRRDAGVSETGGQVIISALCRDFSGLSQTCSSNHLDQCASKYDCINMAIHGWSVKGVLLCFFTFRIWSNPELIDSFVSGWGDRYCNNVNYVKKKKWFEPPKMRACYSTPRKQNQDFAKEHNRTPLSPFKCLKHLK